MKDIKNIVAVEFKNDKTMIFTENVLLNLDEIKYISYDKDSFNIIHGYTPRHIRFIKRNVENG